MEERISWRTSSVRSSSDRSLRKKAETNSRNCGSGRFDVEEREKSLRELDTRTGERRRWREANEEATGSEEGTSRGVASILSSSLILAMLLAGK